MFSYLKYLKYLFRKKYPAEITFFVTGRCNFRCRHCFNRQDNRQPSTSEELTIAQIQEMTQTMPPLLRLSLSGGEPFLRHDLIQICQAFYKNCRPKFITIPSNGSLTDQTIEDAEEIARTCPRSFIYIGLSLDGVGSQRDQIVGRDNTSESLIKTARGLKALQQKYDNLGVGVITTQTPENENGLEEIRRFALNELGVDNFGFNVARKMNFKEDIAIAADLEIYRNFTRRLMRKRKSPRPNMPLSSFFVAKKNLVFERVYKTYKEKKYQSRCFSGRLRVVINEAGDVYPCEMFQFCADQRRFLMGNIKDHGLDFNKLFFSNRAQQIKEDIDTMKCFCAHECDLETNILFNPKILPQILLEAARSKLDF